MVFSLESWPGALKLRQQLATVLASYLGDSWRRSRYVESRTLQIKWKTAAEAAFRIIHTEKVEKLRLATMLESSKKENLRMLRQRNQSQIQGAPNDEIEKTGMSDEDIRNFLGEPDGGAS